MKNRTKFWNYIATLMPNRLVYACYMNVFGYATKDKYGDTEVPGITAMLAGSRYYEDKIKNA